MAAYDESDKNDSDTYRTESCTGGFAGAAMSVEVSNSYFEGTLKGEEYIGGLIGSALKVLVKNCYVKASIARLSEQAQAGGIFGYAAAFGTVSRIGNNQISKSFADISADSPADAFAAACDQKFEVSQSYYAQRESITSDGGKYDMQSVSALEPEQQTAKSAYAGFDFDKVWGFDKDGNLLLRAFGEAYDPPVPPDLTWLWIFLGCTLFGATALFGGLMLYRRKKTVITTETVVETKIETIVVEVPSVRMPLPGDLTKQEKLVAQYILQGKSRPQIADAMGVTDGTIKTYSSRIYIKCGVENQKEFIARYLSGENIL